MRCSTMSKLWEALPQWEQWGAEIKVGGYEAPDWIKAQGVDKLVPDGLVETIVS